MAHTPEMINDILEENARLRNVLEFYAERKNYYGEVVSCELEGDNICVLEVAVLYDNGRAAQYALNLCPPFRPNRLNPLSHIESYFRTTKRRSKDAHDP